MQLDRKLLLNRIRTNARILHNAPAVKVVARKQMTQVILMCVDELLAREERGA